MRRLTRRSNPQWPTAKRSSPPKDAWRAAEKAYADEASKYVAAWWVAEGPPPTMPEPVSYEVLDKLTQLRAGADSARTAYRNVLGES